MGLLLQGWDDGLTNVAGLEVSIHLGGIGVDELVVPSAIEVSIVNAEDVVLELVILEEVVGVVSWVSKLLIVVVSIVLKVARGQGAETVVGKGLSSWEVVSLDIVVTSLKNVNFWVIGGSVLGSIAALERSRVEIVGLDK